ncbi:ABC transporter permease [uncultured Oscillibacter sp.]|uniref:ABC transporter permease n=1 Tax=uncultured Oscillibacter sp. TaxID=876091 RepID=UPI0025E9D50F|nr:ABC transporter permease [uncultured Oscillibacter sp.]
MKYALKRAAALLATMAIVSFLTFAAFDLISDTATVMLGTSATPERLAALRAELGLDRPLPVRYGEWLLGFFTGDLGVSTSYHQPVWDILAPKVGLTLCLSLMSFALIAAVSIPLGLWSAGRRRLEGARTALNQLGMAVPPFFTGILLSWIFGVGLKWFTPGQFPDAKQDLGGAALYLLFAAVALAIPRIAMTARMLRGTVQEELGKDYVRTAISRGNDRGQVLRRHVLKNALPPVVTFLAQTMAEIVAGSIVVEQVFVIPGLGRMLVTSIHNRDYPVVQAIVVILAFWVVLAGTLADLIDQRIDPRLRFGGAA